MASTAPPTAPPTDPPTALSSTASTARRTVPLARPAARPASRARRTGFFVLMHRWELTIVVAAVVLSVAILLDVVASPADLDRNAPPMYRQYDYDALLDMLRPPPEPFEATAIKVLRKLFQTTLDRVDNDYLTLLGGYDTANQTVINNYEKLHTFRTQGLPIFDRALSHLGDEISAYINASKHEIEKAVMSMARVLLVDADEINMRWGAQPPSGLVNHARRLIFDPPDVDPEIVRDRNLWDTVCICQARLIELSESLVQICNAVEALYRDITPPFFSVRDFMHLEILKRRQAAEMDIAYVDEGYVNEMWEWKNRPSNRLRHSSNLFVQSLGRMLGGQMPPIRPGHVEQYEASVKTLHDLGEIQADLTIAQAQMEYLRRLTIDLEIQIPDFDDVDWSHDGKICESLETDSFWKQSRESPQEILAFMQGYLAAFVEGVRRWDADDFHHGVQFEKILRRLSP